MIEEENKQLEAEGETKKKAIEEEKNQSELEAKKKQKIKEQQDQFQLEQQQEVLLSTFHEICKSNKVYFDDKAFLEFVEQVNAITTDLPKVITPR